MKKYILSALILMATGLQTMWAQKLLIYKTDSQIEEYEVSELDSIVFVSKKQMPSYLTCPDDNHPHVIDLGLPSGTKWCCCNVGASSPEEYGGYYAWGETSVKNVYNELTYLFYDGLKLDNNGDGYYDENRIVINIGSDIAGTSYDVAHVRMGGDWRMPSFEQQIELMANCDRLWTQQNGVNCILLTGPSGGQILLPTAGVRWNDELLFAGKEGNYWSSTLVPDPSFDSCAYDIGVFWSSSHSGDCSWGYYGDNRAFGYTVRAVCK